MTICRLRTATVPSRTAFGTAIYEVPSPSDPKTPKQSQNGPPAKKVSKSPKGAEQEDSKLSVRGLF